MTFFDENERAFSEDDAMDGDEETGSDELLSADTLRLPESASPLVRVHAVRAWLRRRREEANLELGMTALRLQDLSRDHDGQETRLRRRARMQEQDIPLQRAQDHIKEAQLQITAFDEAAELLEEYIDHTTTGSRVLIEYYLALDDLLLNTPDDEMPSTRRAALIETQDRVSYVSASSEDD